MHMQKHMHSTVHALATPSTRTPRSREATEGPGEAPTSRAPREAEFMTEGLYFRGSFKGFQVSLKGSFKGF